MKNIFEVSLESHYQFEWDKLGNIKKGREHLGEEMPVLVYRLLEYTMNDVLFINLKVGILRMEEADFEKGEFVITIHEDLDCSGLPPTGEVVCKYDEGFFAGILEAYTKKPFKVREVDCWSSGSRVCRFKGTVDDDR